LMDAPPPEKVAPFLAVARLLRVLGYSAPDVRAADSDAGLLLLEDFGDFTYMRLLEGAAAPADAPGEAALYALAVDLLIDLHRKPADALADSGLPPYDDARLAEECLLFVDWYLPAIRGGATPTEAERRAYAALWPPLFATLRDLPETLVLRDFHVDNLIWLPGRSGLAACGLLDFQDAVMG
ncbi:MAG: phosphotransferase, partial [Alphaproteobacteria bacterium]